MKGPIAPPGYIAISQLARQLYAKEPDTKASHRLRKFVTRHERHMPIKLHRVTSPRNGREVLCIRTDDWRAFYLWYMEALSPVCQPPSITLYDAAAIIFSRMRGNSGYDRLRRIMERHPECPIKLRYARRSDGRLSRIIYLFDLPALQNWINEITGNG